MKKVIQEVDPYKEIQGREERKQQEKKHSEANPMEMEFEDNQSAKSKQSAIMEKIRATSQRSKQSKTNSNIGVSQVILDGTEADKPKHVGLSMSQLNASSSQNVSRELIKPEQLQAEKKQIKEEKVETSEGSESSDLDADHFV